MMCPDLSLGLSLMTVMGRSHPGGRPDQIKLGSCAPTWLDSRKKPVLAGVGVVMEGTRPDPIKLCSFAPIRLPSGKNCNDQGERRHGGDLTRPAQTPPTKHTRTSKSQKPTPRSPAKLNLFQFTNWGWAKLVSAYLSSKKRPKIKRKKPKRKALPVCPKMPWICYRHIHGETKIEKKKKKEKAKSRLPLSLELAAAAVAAAVTALAVVVAAVETAEPVVAERFLLEFWGQWFILSESEA